MHLLKQPCERKENITLGLHGNRYPGLIVSCKKSKYLYIKGLDDLYLHNILSDTKRTSFKIPFQAKSNVLSIQKGGALLMVTTKNEIYTYSPLSHKVTMVFHSTDVTPIHEIAATSNGSIWVIHGWPPMLSEISSNGEKLNDFCFGNNETPDLGLAINQHQDLFLCGSVTGRIMAVTSDLWEMELDDKLLQIQGSRALCCAQKDQLIVGTSDSVFVCTYDLSLQRVTVMFSIFISKLTEFYPKMNNETDIFFIFYRIRMMQ